MTRKRPTKENNVGRMIRHAANVLEDRTWVQGRFGTLGTSVCAMAAIEQSHHTVPRRQLGNAIDIFNGWLRINGLVGPSGTVVQWNDAPGRTKEEVISTMRRFADEMDPLINE